MVTVDRDYRAGDLLSELKEFPAPPQFRSILPHALKDIKPVIDEPGFLGYRIIRIGF